MLCCKLRHENVCDNGLLENLLGFEVNDKFPIANIIIIIIQDASKYFLNYHFRLKSQLKNVVAKSASRWFEK